jgi:hypothetical protein
MDRKAIRLENVKGSIQFIVSGQGVFIFSTKCKEEVHFRILNKEENDGFKVKFTLDQVLVNRIGILEPLIDKNNKTGLSTLSGAYYWFSIDSQNQIFSAGIGEARKETLIYSYIFTLDKTNKLFLETLDHICIDESIQAIRLIRDPITSTVPLLVKTTENVTMNSIASGLHMHKPNLSSTAQKLFDCISGERFILNDDDFLDFSKAIEHSISNPSGWCYKTLQRKSTEFSKDKPNLDETYIRITLGQNNGESPGIPYVMEIWPPNHYSPIHNHAGAEAIIRVLHGQINVSLYPFLGSQQSFNTAEFEKDDITWISSTLNQTHQLYNKNSNTTCITIQCYMYDGEDVSHYDYFDYIDPDGKVEQYEPDSDMDFIDFKQLMKDEWTNKNVNDKIESKKLSMFCCLLN